MLTKNKRPSGRPPNRPAMPPVEGYLEATLGTSFPVLSPALAGLRAVYPDIEPEWRFSPRSGWYQIWALNDRRLFYLLPRPGGFRLNVVLGDRAIAELQAGPHAVAFRRWLRAAKRYPEGTAVSFSAERFDPDVFIAVVEAKIG